MNEALLTPEVHILLVEGSAVQTGQIRGMLEAAGFQVSRHSIAEAFLSDQDEILPDLIILASPPSDVNGFELIRQLRLNPRTRAVPVIMLTSLANGEYGVKGAADMLAGAYETGIDDIVPSTLPAGLLQMRIRTLIHRKRMQDADWRSKEEHHQQELAAARAQAEAASAEALGTKRELEEVNRHLQGAQAQLVQSAKMASLGELVAGIAHEINNPLAYVLAHQGTVERLLGEIAAKLPSGSGLERQVTKTCKRVSVMRLGLGRIQELVVNLRRFSRLDEGDLQLIDIPQSIETVLALLGPKLGPRIEVRRHYAAAPDLYCSPALLNQVVMNIIGNAADAIEETGAIDIETSSDETTYTIRISDTGPGIPPELQERIFEPFFTTKPVGSGTGLGLSIAYSVVQAHKGSITVETGPSGGASFIIRIPRPVVQ